jgi:hypothetical protein
VSLYSQHTLTTVYLGEALLLDLSALRALCF